VAVNSDLPFPARDVQALARVAKAAEDLQCRYSEVKYWATTSIGWSLISPCLIRVRQCGVRSAPRRCRSLTLPAPISATAILAEIAEDLVRGVLAKHPDEKTISLLAISVSNLEKQQSVVQLELPLGLTDENRRPGAKKGAARWLADRAVDMIRERFGWEAVGYASVMLGISPSIPDEFRELAEKEL
jgi:DNA polymerase IV